MELAGLEPATSWVRFGRSDRSNSAALQGISRAKARRGLLPITYVCRRFTGVEATRPRLWPKRRRAAVRDARKGRGHASALVVTNRNNLLSAMQVLEAASVIGVIRRTQSLRGRFRF
jgi:hypothetical protein